MKYVHVRMHVFIFFSIVVDRCCVFKRSESIYFMDNSAIQKVSIIIIIIIIIKTDQFFSSVIKKFCTAHHHVFNEITGEDQTSVIPAVKCVR